MGGCQNMEIKGDMVFSDGCWFPDFVRVKWLDNRMVCNSKSNSVII
jgi:hypothetical protein